MYETRYIYQHSQYRKQQAAMPDREKQVSGTLESTVENLGGDLSTRTYAKWLSEEVASSVGSIPLLACCFATGLTDGTLYNGKWDSRKASPYCLARRS